MNVLLHEKGPLLLFPAHRFRMPMFLQGEGLGLPLASYRLPNAPAFQIDITLTASSAMEGENKWHVGKENAADDS